MQDFPLTLDKILDHAAKWHPDVGIATAGENGEIHHTTYNQLRRKSQEISHLLASLGAHQGDRVATLAWNTQNHVEVWYAIMGMGVVCHTLNPRLTAEHLISMVNQSRPNVLIATADLQAQAMTVATASETIERVMVIDGAVTEAPRNGVVIDCLANLLPPSDTGTAEFVWGAFDERSASGLCFTSGSTGAPKGVTYTHRACFLHTLRLLQGDVLGLTSADVVMPAVPMFHANAWGLPFAVPAAGGKLVLPGRHLDGKSLARLIQAENVTITVGVPTVWLGLCDYLAKSGETVPSLKRIVVGGAPMPPALMDRIENELGVIVQTSWGMTELTPVGTIGVLSDPDRRPEVSGRPALGVDFLLLDQSGQPLENQRGHEGHLHVRGAAVIDHYFGHETTALNEQGWFDTGDLAKLDEKGNLLITGRAKDLIKSGGEWINPTDIEAIISSLPQVSLAAVIGRSDDKWSERPVLLVELREGAEISDDALLESLKGQVASWWIPDDVIRLDAMPIAPTGKINKLALRVEFGARPAS